MPASDNLLRQLFAPNVVVLTADVEDHLGELYDTELDCIRAAVPNRREEFSTGRVLARRGLAQLGLPSAPVLRGPHNEPQWPAGVCGSITHADSYCAVVLARASDAGGIGIDIEKADADVDKVMRLILHQDEIRQTDGLAARDREGRVRLIFSAKEAIFKAIFPTINRFVEFEEVVLEFDVDTHSFTASAPGNASLAALLARGCGRFGWSRRFVATAFQLGVDPPG